MSWWLTFWYGIFLPNQGWPWTSVSPASASWVPRWLFIQCWSYLRRLICDLQNRCLDCTAWLVGQQEEKDKVSRLLTALDSVECFSDPWWFWVIIWWLGTWCPRGEGETAYFLCSFQSCIGECSEQGEKQHCGFRGQVHLEQDPDWVGLHTEKQGLGLRKPSQVTCFLEAEGELRQIGRAAILERQPLR